MSVKKYGDLISGIFLLIITSLYASRIGEIEIINSGSVDAAFIPKLVSGIMFFLSICLIVTSVYKLKVQRSEKPNIRGDERGTFCWFPALLTALLLILYVVFFEKLGFLITTSIYLFAQLMVLAPERSIKGTVRFAVASVAAAYILQYIFIRLLYVMLPEGLLR